MAATVQFGPQPLHVVGGGTSRWERYLEMAGINDFSLFPDLDGLARLLQRRLPPRGENEWPT
jgi:hypothetical protein